MITRDFLAETGSRFLPRKGYKNVSLPQVLSMFSTSGLSESERLELGHMMQRFILQGYLHGVNVPKLMEMRKQFEGKLNVSFNDNNVFQRNTIQFDRDFWRTRPIQTKMKDFVNRIGTRLTAPISTSQPPQGNYALRQGITSGPLKKKFPEFYTNNVQMQVNNVNIGSSIQNIFKTMLGFQAKTNIEPPKMNREQPLAYVPPSTQAMLDSFNKTTETRENLIRNGANPLTIQAMAPRSGVASPSSLSNVDAIEQMKASGRPARVLIWGGSGAWYAEAEDAKKHAAEVGMGADIVKSLSGVDYSKYAAIIVPGGMANTEYAGMGSTEAARLKQAVNGGLNYMGHCAGAFLAGSYGSWGLGLTPIGYNVEGTYNTGDFLIDIKNMTNYDNSKDRYMMEQGGPDLTPGAGTVLGTFPDGRTTAIKETTYGSGNVILTSTHPGMGTGRDGPDDEFYRALLKRLVGSNVTTGTPNPDGTTTPTTPVAPITINPPTVTPWSGDLGAVSGGGSGNNGGAPFRKTPVAGMLPENFVPKTFSSELGNVLANAKPLLSRMAGNLSGLNGKAVI